MDDSPSKIITQYLHIIKFFQPKSLALGPFSHPVKVPKFDITLSLADLILKIDVKAYYGTYEERKE